MLPSTTPSDMPSIVSFLLQVACCIMQDTLQQNFLIICHLEQENRSRQLPEKRKYNRLTSQYRATAVRKKINKKDKTKKKKIPVLTASNKQIKKITIEK